MIDYFYLDKRVFDQELLENKNHCQFIFNLFSFLKRGSFNLVISKEFYDHFLSNKNFILDNILRLRIEKLVKAQLRKKIRFLKKELTDDIFRSLKGFKLFDKFIELDNPKKKDESFIFFNSQVFDLYRDDVFERIEQGKLFNVMNESEFEKMILGVSTMEITVYNFIDNIFDPFDQNKRSYDFNSYLKKPKNLINRNTLSFSLDYICNKIINARNENQNFFECNKSIILNINCRSTKKESFFYNYRNNFNEFLDKYLNNELLNFENIKNFLDIGGELNLKIYPHFAAEGYVTLDGEETHLRYLQSENGVFSISKDLDIFGPKEDFAYLKRNISDYRYGSRNYPYLKNIEFNKKPIRIGYSSLAHPFISMGFPDTPPVSVNLNKFLS